MKKVVSLMLVLVLALGMATAASAASKSNVLIKKGSDKQAQIEGLSAGSTSYSGTEIDVGDIVVQGGALTWYSDLIDFAGVEYDTDGYKVPAVGTGGVTGLTEKDIKNSKITLKTVLSKGAAAVKTDDTEIVYDGPNNSDKFARVRLEFNDEFKSNNKDGIDFTVKFFLVVDGRQWSDSGLTVEGTYKNDTDTYSDASDGYVYMGDGIIIEADEYGKNIEMDLDNGVSVFGKMFKEKKYWAKSSMDSYNDDEDLLMDKYDIDTVYHIKQVGVAAVADYVKLNDEASDMFVYDGELNYLGKGDEKLPFSETYYLSAKQLEIEEDEEPIDEEDPSSDSVEDPGDLGGDDFYPENVNDNPGTGR